MNRACAFSTCVVELMRTKTACVVAQATQALGAGHARVRHESIYLPRRHGGGGRWCVHGAGGGLQEWGMWTARELEQERT